MLKLLWKEVANLDKRWILYLYEFHVTRDYYICHDYLEEWWFEIDKPKHHLLGGFIQLAVGMYHYRRGSNNAARGLFEKALSKFIDNADKLIEYQVELSIIDDVRKLIDSDIDNAFVDYNIPISKSLVQTVKAIAKSNNREMYQRSNLEDDQLINKHLHKNRK
jgi:predicted metal-dependent hydrolase